MWSFLPPPPPSHHTRAKVAETATRARVNMLFRRQAYVALIKEWLAKRIVVIYEDNDGLIRLQEVLTRSRDDLKVHLAQLPDVPDQDYRYVDCSATCGDMRDSQLCGFAASMTWRTLRTGEN